MKASQSFLKLVKLSKVFSCFFQTHLFEIHLFVEIHRGNSTPGDSLIHRHSCGRGRSFEHCGPYWLGGRVLNNKVVILKLGVLPGGPLSLALDWQVGCSRLGSPPEIHEVGTLFLFNEFGKIIILHQTLHGDDIYQKGCVWVILWNIFQCRMMRRARFYGDIFGKQMKDHSTGAGTCIKLNLGRMT
jgi:hypothetical protein